MAAGGVAILLAEAVQVFIAALGELEGQFAPAHPAEPGPLQVVVVPGLARPPCGEKVLDPVQGGGVGERLVQARELDALPGHDPGVGLVRQDVGEGGHADGLHGPVAAFPVAQAPVVERTLMVSWTLL